MLKALSFPILISQSGMAQTYVNAARMNSEEYGVTVTEDIQQKRKVHLNLDVGFFKACFFLFSITLIS